MSESVQTGAGATKQKVRTETSATAGEAKQAASQVAGTLDRAAPAPHSRRRESSHPGPRRGRDAGIPCGGVPPDRSGALQS